MSKKRLKYEGKDVATIETQHKKSVKSLLKEYGVDTKIWEVSRVIINTWDTNIGNGKTKPLYQTKIWLQKKIPFLHHEKFINELKEDLKKYSNKKVKKIKYNKKKNKDYHLAEINLFDVHFGKLGWKEETGSNYDTKIAYKRFMNSLTGLIEKANIFGVDKIVFPVGNDFFHSDNAFPYPQTTSGTPQQEDLRWQKSFREGRKLIVEGINYLSNIAPVDVVVIPGNHDFQKSFYLGDVLEMMYSNNPNVNINNKAYPRKYYRYHNTLIGYTHGNRKNETEKRLVLLMPQEASSLWAKTKFREWHLGDIHHKKVLRFQSELDNQGLVLRYMKSISGSDAWHSRKGYIGAQKGGEAYLHHKKFGCIANFNYNIVS